MTWRIAQLADVVTDAKPGFACGEDPSDGVFQFRMNNVTQDGRVDLSKQRRVPRDSRNLSAFLLKPGDVLFNATNSPELVGKTAFIGELDEPAVFSNHFVRLRSDGALLDGRFLARWLQLQFQRRLFQGMCRQWVNQASVGRDALLALQMPLPPVEKQRRIADVLDRADALRAKRRAAIAELDGLRQSLFAEFFGNASSGGLHRLGALARCADVVSGVTKGRQLGGRPTVTVPYLRVANVQAGFLDLSEIKTIEALPTELAELRLQIGDIVLTEGGDFDKLGRGAMWQGQVADCIHQNHVFRVRVHRDVLVPTFLHEYLQTAAARAYFLRCAKRTTNLASINMTQLRALPVPLPPLSFQREFARNIESIERLRTLHANSLTELDALFAALQHRAFRGEL